VSNDREDPKRVPIGQKIMYEIHAPALGGGPPAPEPALGVARYALGGGPACAAAIHPGDTAGGRVCDSPASLRDAGAPRSADTPIVAGHGPDPECACGVLIDPSRGFFDTRGPD